MSVDYQDFTTKDTPKGERRRLGVGDVWANQAKCLLCGDVVRSNNRHDFKRCSCENLAVDGGSWYPRRIYNNDHSILEMSEYYNDVKDRSLA